MIPYSYNMVDMQGVDLADVNGKTVDGLYELITEAINMCGDVILYNWKFSNTCLPPSACDIIQGDSSIIINGMIQVTELDEVILLFEPVPVPEPVINSLSVIENGEYTVPQGVDGFNPVNVNVPEKGESMHEVLSTKRFCIKFFSPNYYGAIGSAPEWPESGTVTTGDNIVTQNTYTSFTVSEIIKIIKGGILEYSEFLGYVTSRLISDFGLVELARVTSEPETNINLLDSISNYSAIFLQGIWNAGGVSSNFDSTLIYYPAEIGIEYKTGMKDRWAPGTTGVIFTSDTTATLTGEKLVIIYGMP